RREFRRQTASATRLFQDHQAHLARLAMARASPCTPPSLSPSNFTTAYAHSMHSQAQNLPPSLSIPTAASVAVGRRDPNGAVAMSAAARRAHSASGASVPTHPFHPSISTAPATSPFPLSSMDHLPPHARDQLRRYYVLQQQQQQQHQMQMHSPPLHSTPRVPSPPAATTRPATATAAADPDPRLLAAAAKWAAKQAPSWIPPSPPASPDREGEVDAQGHEGVHEEEGTWQGERADQGVAVKC
ncbi:hypothetical protein HDU93_003726, partial [Gonapodya sp. JEL0774]